jgi:hypothetical protein
MQSREETAMSVLRWLTVLAALIVATMALMGCERKITRVEVVQGTENCFSCHSDANTVLVDAEQQWNNSRHASGSTLNENDSSCKGCHTSEGFIARATGVTPPDVIENPTAIHCFTCHAPHTNGDFRLRWTATATLANGTSFNLNSGNLCVACHQARRSVTTYVAGRVTLSSRWGPHHGVQGDMLLGSNGYEYAGYTYNRTAHREVTTADGKDGCLECHFKATSQYVVGGHTFNMRGEVNGEEILNVGACEPCHGPIDDFNEVGPGYSVQDSVDILVTDLKTRLVAAGLVDATSGLPRSTSTSADSAGAVWNYLITGVEDRSRGVHNAQYIMGLLKSSILYIDGTLAPQVALRSAHD